LEDKVALFCDSDDINGVNTAKEGLKELGVKIFDCENNYCIEQQIFQDLSWDGVKELIEYALRMHYIQ